MVTVEGTRRVSIHTRQGITERRGVRQDVDRTEGHLTYPVIVPITITRRSSSLQDRVVHLIEDTPTQEGQLNASDDQERLRADDRLLSRRPQEDKHPRCSTEYRYTSKR